MLKNKAVFFDRDGVLIFDPGRIRSIDQIKIFSRAVTAVSKLKQSGFLIIIISNQSIVARGEITLDQMERIDEEVRKRFAKRGAEIDAAYYCPHHPDFTGECNCRKPKPGLFFRAIKERNIDPKSSYVIGDKPSDVEAGKRAGCKLGILVRRNQEQWDYSQGHKIFIDKKLNNLIDATDYILREKSIK